MSWKSTPKYDFTPIERASKIIRKFKTIIVEETITSEEIFNYTSKGCAITFQEGIIKKLKNHGIDSDYDNEVLKEIKKYQ